jgi:ribosomal protein S18 acetylase RimI-like enzyme
MRIANDSRLTIKTFWMGGAEEELRQGVEWVDRVVNLYCDCAYAPNEHKIGIFLSQVFVNPNAAPFEKHVLIVALLSEDLVGALFGRLLNETADLDYVGVKRDQRGQGIGCQLIQQFESISAQNGAQRVLLEVSDRNVPALAAYRSAGYEKISVRKRYYPSGEDALVMEKHLE